MMPPLWLQSVSQAPYPEPRTGSLKSTIFNGMDTELLYLDDAYLREMTATVVETREGAVALDRTVFYPTGGGQACDTGELRWATEAGTNAATVTAVKKEGPFVWHTISAPDGSASGHHQLEVGQSVDGLIDWGRRHELMRTHTALHILCGVIWNEWGRSVTGGNMEPLSARMDFEFDPLPEGFAARITELVNSEIAAARPIEVGYLDRPDALADEDLIRTKVNMIPEFVTKIRVVDIVGLDKQADGGTHVANTGDVGHFEVTKTESKGKGNKRVRIQLSDSV
jgi:misacylated tRNA(Ala) deacylase